MNKNYFFLVLLLCNTILFAQNNDFNNNGEDLLWSNPANWSLTAIPTSTNTVRLPFLLESLVNKDFTVLKIQTTSATGASSTAEIKKAVVAGTNTLTVDAGNPNGIGIQNNSANNVDFSFKGKVIINNSSAGFTRMNNANGANNSITFQEDSELTLQTGLDLANNGSGGDNFNFNGTITGSANLRLTGTTINTFGSTSSNADYTGQIVFIGSSQLIVNTVDNNTFYNGEKIQVNANNASVVLNGENVFGAGVNVGGANTFSFSANKNQNSMKTVTFTGAGTLNMTIDNSVTNLSFENSSEATWEAGSTLNITNYQEGVLRFGTDNTGLTSNQLTKIVIDGVSDSVGLNGEGYLVNKTSLSINDFNENAVTPIAYPTLASDNIYFKKLQNNVKIFDLNGKMILENQSINQSEIAINSLTNGIYLIIFDNKKIEKFIKQ
jgi:hypothetical protein